jgi:ATP adenylyltransferase
MDKLWSPWRSEYIETFKQPKDDKCIFCHAAEQNMDDDESLVVYKSNHCFVILNLYPYNNGHVMVVPYRHVSEFTALTQEEKIEMIELVDYCMKAMEEKMCAQGFNMGANIGKAAGAGIDDHLHIHIVPRWNGDTNFMPALGEVKVISQDLLKSKHELRSALTDLLNNK